MTRDICLLSETRTQWTGIQEHNLIPTGSPLCLTSALGLVRVVENFLQKRYSTSIDLENSIDVNAKDTNSRTPLSFAAKRGHEGVDNLLLAISEIDADSKDEEGRTPLWMAAENRHEAVVKLELEALSAEDPNFPSMSED
jgi:ankyrin repeat protein